MEIIAEIGQNHNGDMSIAAKLIRAAKKNGADVAKFQLYDAKSLFPKVNNPWYQYNCKTEISRKQVEFLAKECKKVGIEFMSSVFDIERVAWLEEVGVKRHKVASRSINDKLLIKELAKTGKPILVSLGMWNKKTFPKISSKAQIDYLYCISKYPTELGDLHLNKVDFKKYIGFSDHTIGISAPMAALTLGAQIIEKHFTLDKKMYGPDHKGSMTPEELNSLNIFRQDIERLL